MSFSKSLKTTLDKIKASLEHKEHLVGVDIGTSSLRVAQLSEEGDIEKAAFAPLSSDCFAGSVIAKPDKVGEIIRGIFDELAIKDLRVATAIPIPNIFSKKIVVERVAKKDLRATIALEAASSIPHPIDAVALDYQVLNVLPNNKLEILVVAVKNEIVQSYLEAFMVAGVEVAVMDIDTYALQTAIETARDTSISGATVGLINMGSKYSSVNVVSKGQSLATGDISVGGKHLSEALIHELGITVDDAEKLKRGGDQSNPELSARVSEITKKYVENTSSELNRQLSLLWSSSGKDDSINKIILSGAGSLCAGLAEGIAQKTGIETGVFNPFKEFSVSSDIPQSVRQEGPRFGIVCGLSLRSPGDRIFPEGF